MAKGIKDWISTYRLNCIQGKKMRVCEGSKAAQLNVHTIRTIRRERQILMLINVYLFIHHTVLSYGNT